MNIFWFQPLSLQPIVNLWTIWSNFSTIFWHFIDSIITQLTEKWLTNEPIMTETVSCSSSARCRVSCGCISTLTMLVFQGIKYSSGLYSAAFSASLSRPSKNSCDWTCLQSERHEHTICFNQLGGRKKWNCLLSRRCMLLSTLSSRSLLSCPLSTTRVCVNVCVCVSSCFLSLSGLFGSSSRALPLSAVQEKPWLLHFQLKQ